MNRYLLDTNHLGEAVGRVSVVRDRLQQAQRHGAIFALTTDRDFEALPDIPIENWTSR